MQEKKMGKTRQKWGDRTHQMNDKELIKITTEFTSGLLGRRSPKGACFIVCAPLQGYLSFCGCETDVIKGEIESEHEISNHFWLKLKDGRILDPTASQFIAPDGKRMPKTYLGNKPEWYKII